VGPTLTAKSALLFDLDGSLVDSVNEHVLSFRVALHEMKSELSALRIHWRVGHERNALILTALQRDGPRNLEGLATAR
jgi:phosphoglycolate phosphatase-like HAD superfamily hydrolase